MRKIRLLATIIIAIFLLSVLIFLVIGSLKPKVAGIYIDTVPSSTVWLNGIQVGVTPFRDTMKPGETVVRLVPQSAGAPLNPYETKVKLVSGVETVIRYSYGISDDYSSGELISFEKSERKETSLVAVTIPDSTEFVIDQGIKVFTPYKTSSISPGEHILRFHAQGYVDREVKVKTFENFKLTAVVKLAKSEKTPEPVVTIPPVTPAPSGQVEILSTDTGFLRVRSEPSTLSDEVGRVEPGKKYALIATDEQTGWYKIEYAVGSAGWVSSQYARKVGAQDIPESEVSATPSATLTPTSTTLTPP